MNRSYEMAFPKEANIDFYLPDEVCYELINHSKSDLLALSCVSKQFAVLAKVFAASYRPKDCFGRADWLNFGGDIGVEPSLPLKMIQDFDPLKWMLTLIPEKINGEPLNLISIDHFVSDYKNGKNGFKTNYSYPLIWFEIENITEDPVKIHWVLLSKDVLGGDDLINGTRNKSNLKQEELVKREGYEIPGLIDTIVTLFMHHLKTGEFIYPSESNGHLATFTRVKELNCWDYQLAVGGFSSKWISVKYYPAFASQTIGASCAKRSVS